MGARRRSVRKSFRRTRQSVDAGFTRIRKSIRRMRKKDPWLRPTVSEASDAIVLNTTGTLLGFVRFGYFLAAFIVLTVHLALPPSTESPVEPGEYEWVNYLAGIFHYSHFAVEVIASLIVVGDAVVTWSTLTGALGSSSTFMAQSDLKPLLARTLLVLITCSSHSTRAEEFIVEHWGANLATAYQCVPALTLISWFLMLLIYELRGFSEHAWLRYETPTESDDEEWTPNMTDQEKTVFTRRSENQCPKFIKILCLMMPIGSFVLTLIALVVVLIRPEDSEEELEENIVRNPESIRAWRGALEKVLHMILNLVLIGFLAHRIRKYKELKIPTPIKACLIYVILTAMTHVAVMKVPVIVIVGVYTFGLFLIVIPLVMSLVTTSNKQTRSRALSKMAWIRGFVGNFRHLGKWLRLLEVIAVVLSLAGLMLAVLSLPLDWFRIHFENDPELDDFMETVRKFNKSLSDAEFELKEFVKMTEDQFKDITCEQMAGALAGAAVTAFIPGVGQVTKQVLKVGRYMRGLGRKVMTYKSQFYRLTSMMRKVKGVVNDVKKPLMVGVTMKNFGMIMFLTPVIITGVVVVFFAFWPRKLRSWSEMQGKKKCVMVIATALLHFVFNVVGLMLFELWGPMLATIADSLPLTTAELIKEPGWNLVERGYSCTVGASIIFLLLAVSSVFRPDKELEKEISQDEQPIMSDVTDEEEPPPRKSRMVTIKEPTATFSPIEEEQEATPYAEEATLTISNETQPHSENAPMATSHAKDVSIGTPYAEDATMATVHAEDASLATEKTQKLSVTLPTRDDSEKVIPRRKKMKVKAAIKDGSDELRKWMFRYSMMDTAPPRAWVLSLIITGVAVLLSIMALTQEWMTFDPVMKPKWARIMGELDQQSNSSKVLQEELDKDTRQCLVDIKIDLKGFLPTIVSPELKQFWKDLMDQIKLPMFQLFDLDFLDLNYRVLVPQLMRIMFSVPNFICCGLVITGFITSFSVRASYYFPTSEVMSWISKISIFVLVGIMNTIIFITKVFTGTSVPFYNLNIKIHPGFILSSAAAALILIVWILLVVETMAPPTYVTRTKKKKKRKDREVGRMEIKE